MSSSTSPYGALALLFRYPEADYPDRAENARRSLEADHPDLAERIAGFVRGIISMSRQEQEELFTRTFDLSPRNCLEIGWHLFGESYHRGAFLVRVREELRRVGLQESQELPDHLSHVLELLDRMRSPEADRFASSCVQPAVERLLDGLGNEKSMYVPVLETLGCLLRRNHPDQGESDA